MRCYNYFFFSSRRRHTRSLCDWSSDVCSSDLDTDATISRPEGGFFLWIKLPSGTDKKRLAERAVEARIQYTPGPVFYANGGGEDYIRLAFSYEQPDKCYEGARMLAKAMLSA